MKRLIAETYKLLYKITRARRFSAYVAIAYITLLNMITLKGIGLLTEGWLSFMVFLRVLFVFPNYIVTALIIFSLYVVSMSPLSSLKKERQKPMILLPVLGYTLLCAILILYMRLNT